MISVPQRLPCVRLRELEDYISGRLLAPAADDLEQHVADCDECAAQLESALEKNPPPLWMSAARELLTSTPPAIAAESNPAPAPADQAAEPSRFPNRSSQYSRVQMLGSGGMGVVWKGWDHLTKRAVALKQLAPGNTDLRGVQRLLKEARALARLSHPNVVSVFDVISDDANPLLVMEYVDGMTLSAWQQGQPVSATEAAELTAVIASALQHAHGHGVIHRDLKPSNILLQTQEPRQLPRAAAGQPQLKITDFGIARISGDPTFTVGGQPLGTPSYMAPEQIDGVVQDSVATDVYACGVLLYELLTGRPPFIASDPAVALLLIQSRDPAPLRILQPHLPRDIETICLKCLSRRPQDRYASAGALAADLHAFLAGHPIQARPVSLITRLIRWSARNRAVAGLLFSTAVSLIAATLFSLRAAHHQRESLKNERKSAETARDAARQEGVLRKRAEEAEKAAKQQALAESSLRARHLALLLKMIRAADVKNAAVVDRNVLSSEVLHDFVLSLREPSPALTWPELELVVRYLSLKQFSQDTSGLETALARVDEALEFHQNNPESPEEFVEFLEIRQQFFAATDDVAETIAANCRRWIHVATEFRRQAQRHPPTSIRAERLLAARAKALELAYNSGLAVKQISWAGKALLIDLLQQIATALEQPFPTTPNPREAEKILLEQVRQELQQIGHEPHGTDSL